MDAETPSQPARLPLAIAFLVAIGAVPASAWAFAQEWIKHNPWLALGLAILYVAGLGVVGLLTQVKKRAEEEYLPRVARRLVSAVEDILSKRRRRYLAHLTDRHQFFDVKGLTSLGPHALELEQVFVELSVITRSTGPDTADPLRQVSEPLRQGRHVIWDFLSPARKGTAPNLAVLGPPGSGKTTLLKHMTLTLAGDRKHRRKANAPDRMPILLFLRDHAEAIKANPDLSLAQAASDNLSRWGPPTPPGWFEAQLERKRCLVLLDGLDEVADPEARKRVVEWVRRQSVAHAGNSFLVSSRPFGYRDNPLEGVTVIEVAPFSLDQTRRFIQNWYTANELMSARKDTPAVRQQAREGAEDLVRRIANSAPLTAMAVNPLLLTMISTVHRYRNSLPGRRVELYAEICDVFLGKRQEAKGLVLDMTPAQKQRVLQYLAFHMMRREAREISLSDARTVIKEPLNKVSPKIAPDDFLKSVSDQSGLVVERENGVYSFAHLTFQEYLAAAHVQAFNLERFLIESVEKSWWHEVIRLYCARADATPIIEACLATDPPSIPALTLAIDCSDEAQEIQPACRERLETLLQEGGEDPSRERRRVIVGALFSRRLRNLTRLDEDRYIDDGFITHAEYQYFLDDMGKVGRRLRPDHWTRDRFPTGQGRSPVVGVRRSDAVIFCEWLTGDWVGHWVFRLPEKDETSTENPSRDPIPQSSPTGYWLKAPGGFAWVRDPESLRDRLERKLAEEIEDDVRMALSSKSALSASSVLRQALGKVFVLLKDAGDEIDLTPRSLRACRVLDRALKITLAHLKILDFGSLGADLSRVADINRRVLEAHRTALGAYRGPDISSAASMLDYALGQDFESEELASEPPARLSRLEASLSKLLDSTRFSALPESPESISELKDGLSRLLESIRFAPLPRTPVSFFESMTRKKPYLFKGNPSVSGLRNLFPSMNTASETQGQVIMDSVHALFEAGVDFDFFSIDKLNLDERDENGLMVSLLEAIRRCYLFLGLFDYDSTPSKKQASYADYHAAFFLFLARLDGTLPPHEGIRIVKCR